MKRILKPVLALVAAFGLLTLLAAPSAASSGTITGGSLTVSLTPTLTTTFGGTGGCTGSSITALDGSTGTTGSTPVSGTISITTLGSFVYNSQNWVFAATSTGTYSSTHNTDSTYAITVHVNLTGGQIREASATDLCASTGTSKCTAITVSSFTLTGTASLTAVHPGPVGTVHLAGNRTVSAFGCTAPFSTLNGKTATIASLTAALS